MQIHFAFVALHSFKRVCQIWVAAFRRSTLIHFISRMQPSAAEAQLALILAVLCSAHAHWAVLCALQL